MPSAPTITIILPTHNRPALLQEAIESVRLQTFHDWELIIVDDGSTPPVERASAWAQDERIRLVRQAPPRGGPAAKNAGVQAATGSVLAFLDDDDKYAPTYLERALNTLNSLPELDLVFMGVHWFGANAQWGENAYHEGMSKTLAEAHTLHAEDHLMRFSENLLSALLNRVPMAFQRPVVRRTAFERVGGYRENCLLWDCDWAIRAALDLRTALLDEPLYMQRAENQGYSSKRDRELEHVLSGVEIREYLLAQSKQRAAWSRSQRLFTESLARALFHLAHFHYRKGNRSQALAALSRSAVIRPSLAHLKFLGRLILPAPNET